MEQDIVNWLNDQPAWVRKASDFFIKNGKIEDNQIKLLADICISEVSGNDCSEYVVKQSNLLNMGTGKAFAIESISDIEGVNAISSDKPMIFSKSGVNVVYGPNGAGKSGYIRILKMVSGATYREDIKANIYQSTKKKPKCNIEITMEDEKRSLACDLTEAGQYEILRKIDIFDTKTAQGYIGDEKEAAFEPWIFELFSALGNVAVEIKADLTKRKDIIQLQEYDIPAELTEMEAIKTLNKITYKSKIIDIVCEMTEQDETKLKELKQKSQIEKNNLIIQLKNKQIKELTELVDYFKLFEDFYSKANIEDLNAFAQDWKRKKEAYRLAHKLLENNIDDIDKINQTNSAWIVLWKTARKLFNETKSEEDIDFTDVGGRCPLCHQEIKDEISQRIHTIDDYVNGETANAERQAKNQYKQKLIYPSIKQTEEVLARTGDFRAKLENGIKHTNQILIETSTLIKDIQDDPIEIKNVDIDEVIKPIKAIITTLQSERDDLIKINTAEDQKKIQTSIQELEAKRIVAGNAKRIGDNIGKLFDIHILDEAIKRTSTNKITAKSKELARLLITDAYIDRFNDELKKLSASGLTAQVIQGKGRKGKIPYKVQLCDADGNYVAPKDILSEGESRAVALAAFFAEASGRAENCPLVVDDPISSLDYEYEGRVISRLIEAAQYRQVIVFTHRISVVVGINEKVSNYTNVSFTELSLKATKDRKGIPSNPNIDAGKSDKLLNKLINESLSKLKKMDELDESYNRERHYLCQQFRNCVEKSVEEFLIGEVVVRFRKDVQTKRIKYLPSITQEDCDIVDNMMTKYSAYDHSMSNETPLIEFTLDEIESDMNQFAGWIKIRKKNIASVTK